MNAQKKKLFIGNLQLLKAKNRIPLFAILHDRFSFSVLYRNQFSSYENTNGRRNLKTTLFASIEDILEIRFKRKDQIFKY